eukprot:GHVN01102168.1.p3 GENE.GHVN01102168.1~~GHVN01102168.1.p3  ORF type:complete len:128 (-),score=19.09 GHVN01102168.1:2227-2610(-)
MLCLMKPSLQTFVSVLLSESYDDVKEVIKRMDTTDCKTLAELMVILAEAHFGSSILVETGRSVGKSSKRKLCFESCEVVDQILQSLCLHVPEHERQSNMGRERVIDLLLSTVPPSPNLLDLNGLPSV